MATTLKMGIDNNGFLLDRFAVDCGPLQYVRELTQNSIEAIRRAGRDKGEIVWSYDDLTFERTGIKKLCITDNGCGMTAEEMVRYLNNLSSSGSVQSIDGNMGIGAKISAAAKNRAGVEYLSWRDGIGHVICFWKDPVSGEYGLKPFENDYGDQEHVALLTTEAIQTQPTIEAYGAGTHVVLHGQTENEDTFSASDEYTDRKAGQWLRKYLNTRYFRLPTNIRIDCRTAGGGDAGFRYVTGQGPVLDAIAMAKGTVNLKNAVAHWWLVPKADSDLAEPVRVEGATKAVASMKSFNPSYFTTGHVAATYQDELHDVIRGNAGRVLLQQFGILIGFDQVVVYVEPTGPAVVPNMARSVLLIDGAALPWGDWADEFRGKLPEEIKAFMARIQPAAHDTKNEDERIRSVMELYKITKYKPSANGAHVMGDPTSSGQLRTGDPTLDPRPEPDPRPRPDSRERKKSAYSELLNSNGQRADLVSAEQELPHLDWVTAENGSRPKDMYPNHAAWFIPPNTIHANADFGGIRDLIDRFASEYPDNEAAKGVVTNVVQSWWSQTLRECVQAMRGLVASGVWTRAQLLTLLSSPPSADLLTAAVMPRYLVMQAINREIRGRIGGATK